MSRRLYLSFFILSISYSANIIVTIYPDTIYVGSLATVSFQLENLPDKAFPEYPDIVDVEDVYIMKDRILKKNSAEYVLQFWKSGLVAMPSLSIDIIKNKKKIYQIKTDQIEIYIYSNINDSSKDLRSIKGMQNIKVLTWTDKVVYSLFIFSGLFIMIYILKNKGSRKIEREYKNYYKKSIFNQSIAQINKLQIPENMNRREAESFYANLSMICRRFINEAYFIRATEMTTKELYSYFHSIGIDSNILSFWKEINGNADKAKYGAEFPSIAEIMDHKEKFIKIVKTLNINRK